MDIFDILNLIGGLCLFLFGMTLMGQALERRAGNGLRTILSKLTTKKMAGFLMGLGVTAIIQSSSATTVMVVGFVNSGIMSLGQSINVIMGANVGTTVTAWILSLGGIESDNIILSLLKPTSFTPVLALIGTAFLMFTKSSTKKDTGTILLGFATLMYGMDTMSASVSGLKDIPAFRELFVAFENPILGMLAGAVLTAVIQSSSASVGILQALTVTGQISYGAAVPIIMGQNIGTCITALLSSFGTNKNAKRAALVHLSFNVIGTIVWLSAFCIIDAVFSPLLFSQAADHAGIAVAHSLFNIACTALLLPMTSLLEKLAFVLVPEGKAPEKVVELDERLFATPAIALEQSRHTTLEMAKLSVETLKESLKAIGSYNPELAAKIRDGEERSDKYEDLLGTYLVHLSTQQLSEENSSEAAMLLRMIGDFERISDHGVNILEAVEEMKEKKLNFTEQALREISVISAAVDEILSLSLNAFLHDDLESATLVEPLEQVIDGLKENLRANHILRMQKGYCTIEAGFVWSDLLADFERTADHCSNIAGCILDMAHKKLDLHEYLREVRNTSSDFKTKYESYARKYSLN
ncbi:MAG: Na/Pi cotransporter family protein [Ruminococcaceae bacterium]|nr:Na/Pi cotransporter family protein [Oscillospiraceae bacterium]